MAGLLPLSLLCRWESTSSFTTAVIVMVGTEEVQAQAHDARVHIVIVCDVNQEGSTRLAVRCTMYREM